MTICGVSGVPDDPTTRKSFSECSVLWMSSSDGCNLNIPKRIWKKVMQIVDCGMPQTLARYL